MVRKDRNNNVAFLSFMGCVFSVSIWFFSAAAAPIFADDLFISTDPNSKYFLQLKPTATSAIDKGADTGVTTDFFGNIRPRFGGYDIGACEYTVVPPENVLFNVTGDGSNYQISIDWDLNPYVDYYVVYYGWSSGASSHSYPNSSGPIYKDDPHFEISLPSTSEYYFALKSTDSQGRESDFTTELATANVAPVISSFLINNVGDDATVRVTDTSAQVTISITATDNALVSKYLIMDGDSDYVNGVFTDVPGGASPSVDFTAVFTLDDRDGTHTVYAWVQDNQGIVSAMATKDNILLDRSGGGISTKSGGGGGGGCWISSLFYRTFNTVNRANRSN